MMGLFRNGFGLGLHMGAGVAGMVVMALLWIGLLLLLIWGIRRLFPRERKTALDVAREVVERRYAAGQITEAEYLQATRTLRADGLDKPAEELHRDTERAEQARAHEEVRQ